MVIGDLPRFIPAPAGNTLSNWSYSQSPSVHPRACGEHNAMQCTVPSVFGSSPRLRGTRTMYTRLCWYRRFIPAPAGNTTVCGLRYILTPVHPRACGEHDCCLRHSVYASGSSPRLRGTHHHVACVLLCLRFIPAPAGNTSAQLPAVFLVPVHPRACGEHTELSEARLNLYGSSPRLRGTPLL